MIREHMRRIGQLLHAWWRVDRIRIAATTGRLLQLAPGDRVLIREHLLMVRNRSVAPCAVKWDGSREPDDSLEPDPDGSTASEIEYRLVDLVDEAVGDSVYDADRVVRGLVDEWRLQIVLPNDGQPSVYRLWTRKRMEELLEDEIVPLHSHGGH